jgi:hypothetical protein
MKGLKKLFLMFPQLDRTSRLMPLWAAQGLVRCRLCAKLINSKKYDVLRHCACEAHLKNAAGAAEQPTLDTVVRSLATTTFMGKDRLKIVRALLTAHLARFPPRLVEDLLTDEFLEALSSLGGSLPSRRTMHDTDLPFAKVMVVESMKKELADLPFYVLAVDKGSTDNLLGGKKGLLVIKLLSPLLSYEPLLAAVPIDALSYVSDNMARDIVNTMTAFELDPNKLLGFAMDNEAINGVAVVKVEQMQGVTAGTYARFNCLDHSFNLVVEALLQKGFPAAADFVAKLSAFMTAGELALLSPGAAHVRFFARLPCLSSRSPDLLLFPRRGLQAAPPSASPCCARTTSSSTRSATARRAFRASPRSLPSSARLWTSASTCVTRRRASSCPCTSRAPTARRRLTRTAAGCMRRSPGPSGTS